MDSRPQDRATKTMPCPKCLLFNGVVAVAHVRKKRAAVYSGQTTNKQRNTHAPGEKQGAQREQQPHWALMPASQEAPGKAARTTTNGTTEGWHPALLTCPDRGAAHRVRARRCRSVHRDRVLPPNGDVWPTDAPTGNTGQTLLARTLWARDSKRSAHRVRARRCEG